MKGDHERVFNGEDLRLSGIKWWEYLVLWLLPAYKQEQEGYVFYWKVWRGKLYLVGEEKKGNG